MLGSKFRKKYEARPPCHRFLNAEVSVPDLQFFACVWFACCIVDIVGLQNKHHPHRLVWCLPDGA